MGKETDKQSALLMRSLLNPSGKNKWIFSIISFIIVVIITILVYLVPDYFFLERLTSETVFQILDLYQYDVSFGDYYPESLGENEFIASVVAFLTGLNTHNNLTPLIIPPHTAGRYAVVRACTGMQAGALLIGLIVVTPADFWNKVKATFYSILALILGNFLRIALVIGMTITLEYTYGATHGTSWYWAHDVLGKPIGFFGTIFFAIIIEKQGVPILNTVSLWIDSLIDLSSYLWEKAIGPVIIPILSFFGFYKKKDSSMKEKSESTEKKESKTEEK